MRSLFLLFVIFVFSWRADAEDRRALIIANAGYAHITPLTNPIRDADLVESTLERAGFEITRVNDADKTAMRAALDAFAADLKASPGAVALVFFSGHGLSSDHDPDAADGRGADYNYVLGVDFVDGAGRDAFERTALRVDGPGGVAQTLSGAGTLQNIVVIDACRNAYTPRSTITTKGFSAQAIQPRADTFFIFATEPDKVALDQAVNDDRQNGPFALAFTNVIQRRGHTLAEMLPAITEEVRRLTGGFQTPYIVGSPAVDVVFFPGVKEGLGELIAGAEEAIWEQARLSGSLINVTAFLDTYPNSRFAPEARILRDRIIAGEPIAPVVTEDPSRSSRRLGLTVAQDFAGNPWTVREIAAGSVFEGKLRPGDELFKIDGTSVRDIENPDSFILERVSANGRVSLIVMRNGRPYTVNLR